MQSLFVCLQVLLLPGDMPQHMQQQGVAYGHPTKSEGRDRHRIVGFGIELLEEFKTLAPSRPLVVHEFLQHDDVVRQMFVHLLVLAVIKLVHFWLEREKGWCQLLYSWS